MQRIKKVNQLIKKELGKIILKETSFSQGTLVTLTEVKTTPNLSQAKIYISIVPEKEKEEVFKELEENIWGIQQILNKKLKMKNVPKIVFVKDKGLEKRERIEEILRKLKKEELK